MSQTPTDVVTVFAAVAFFWSLCQWGFIISLKVRVRKLEEGRPTVRHLPTYDWTKAPAPKAGAYIDDLPTINEQCWSCGATKGLPHAPTCIGRI